MELAVNPIPPESGGWQRVVLGHVEAVVAIALCTVIAVRVVPLDHLATVSCLYLTAIIVVTLRRGRSPGVLASVLSFLMIDYAFLPPVNAVSLPDPIDWIGIASF